MKRSLLLKPMHSLLSAKQFFFIFFLLLVVHAGIAQPQTAWKRLFNGKDLKGWGTYLRPSEAAPDQRPIGLNHDPHKVFTVDNGLLRISGQDWGGIFTSDSFSNYHLRLQVKFGEKKWAPREHVVADGGLLFHCSLPYDFGSTCWMRSIELQIQETDVADYHNVGAGIPLMQLSKGKDGNDVVDQYDPAGIFQLTKNRVYRSTNFESPHGEWTNIDLIARGADAVFIVNGFVVNRVFNIYRQDLHEQTTGGQIQFQSEGAEHFLKDIELRSIDLNKVEAARLVSDRNEVVLTSTPQNIVVTNRGAAVELVAAELLGINLEHFVVQLPKFPVQLPKDGKLVIPVAVKAGGTPVQAALKLETALGPVKNFSVLLVAK